MNNNFINSLIKYLIEKEYFNLICAEGELLDLAGGSISLIKNFQGTSVLLELIQADRYSTDELAGIMENGAAMLQRIDGQNASIFKVFIFSDEPDQEKIKIIEQGQVDIITEKKFMKCISVNVNSKLVQKYFTVPSFDANIVKALKRFFAKNLEDHETTVQDISDFIAHRQKDFEIQLNAKNSWVTYALLAANVLVFLVLKLISISSGTSYSELLVPYGAKVNSLIMQGEYWRFITPMFLHSDIVHLTVNCYSLYIVGQQVEKLFGHGKFTAIYFISGFLGCVASFAFSINVSVGASGAIFGLLGAMLLFAVRRPSLLKSSFGANLVTTLIINLVYGFMNKQIDNYGHIGGLIGGFLTTGVVYSNKEKSSKDKLTKIAALILVAVLSLGGLFYSFNNELNRLTVKVSDMNNYFSDKNWTQTEKLAEEILAQNPSQTNIMIETLWNVSAAEVSQQKYSEAAEHAAKLVEVSPIDGHYILGVIYFNTNQYDKAKEELQASKNLGSSYSEKIDQILAAIGNLNVK
jgi:rhomboid protease GluP